MFALFITFLVMGSIAYTLRQAGSVKANVKNLDQFNEVTHALTLIKADVKAAVRVPSKTEIVDNELTIRRINPALAFLDRTLANDRSDSPYGDEDQVEVRYYIEEGVLRRTVKLPDDSLTSMRLLEIKRLVVDRPGPKELTVTLLTDNNRVGKSRTIKVALVQ